ncbi:MAG: hypothetical protein FJ020_10600 [Chloroflexi bacterium]|nr:hypothetical protein [Chloroflexota bacterium]
MLKRGLTALAWILPLGWMAAVFYLSCQEKEDVSRLGTLFPDYINHGAAYFLLAFLLFMALQRTRPTGPMLSFAVVVGWSLIFGLGMEYAQKYLTQTRHFSLVDLLADGVGAALAVLCLLALSRAGERGRQLYALLTATPR